LALYHREKGFPPHFQPPLGTFRLRYGGHALRAAREDRYGDLSNLLPQALDVSKARLIEVETGPRGTAEKLVYRLPATKLVDLVLVVNVDKSPWGVRTVWGNRRDDTHRTLDLSRYCTPSC
jgi:hypothetical protein